MCIILLPPPPCGGGGLLNPVAREAVSAVVWLPLASLGMCGPAGGGGGIGSSAGFGGGLLALSSAKVVTGDD